MKFARQIKIAIALILITAMTIPLSPMVVLAQSDWGSDQLIEDNTGYDAWKPQVAVSGDNVVAVWYQDDAGGKSRIYSNYSSDGGVNWGSDQLIEDNAGYDAEAPHVAISGDKVVAVWYQYDTGGQRRIYSNYSTDGGVNWGSDQLIEDNAGYDGNTPQVAMSGDNVTAVWVQKDDDNRTRIYSNYSSDGGVNWGSDQLIEDNTGKNAAIYPHLAMSGSNVVAVWAQPQSTAARRIYSNYSTDGGVNWGSDQLIEDNGSEAESPQVAISGDKVIAVWAQGGVGNNRLYSNYSTDGGANWGSDQLIEDNAGRDGWSPKVALSGDNAAVVWRQKDESDSPRVYSNYSTDAGVNWAGDQLIEDNAEDHAYSVTIAMSGSNVIAVWTQNIGQLRVHSNYSYDGGASWEGDQLIEDNSSYSAYTSQVAMSGLNTVAVWRQDDGSKDRIYSNYRKINPPISLNAGWTMISSPVIPDNTDINDVISAANLGSGNPANIVLVYSYNTSSGQWMWWNGSPSSTLTSIVDGRGYWVNATIADTLTIHGTEAGHPGPDYPVLTGWDQIGFTSATAMTPETYLATVLADCGLLYQWTGSAWNWWMNGNPSSSLTNMEPGNGYWLNMSADGTITPP